MVTLVEAKQHLRVESSFTEDDLEIEAIINAATDHLTSIGVEMSADPLPPAIHHAVLLLVGHFFGNKEATNSEQIRFTPLGVDRLIAPYREVNL